MKPSTPGEYYAVLILSHSILLLLPSSLPPNPPFLHLLLPITNSSLLHTPSLPFHPLVLPPSHLLLLLPTYFSLPPTHLLLLLPPTYSFFSLQPTPSHFLPHIYSSFLLPSYFSLDIPDTGTSG
ncbi:hypothetical protein Pmani_009972 [Petrolisthes manimaculis]|uniref:Uncharacterized protein n=1 Tax=Petrolisthes manimaculis TaxID=1843537 RepID=A0AAE1Q3Y6_9EUCA|nr:hypothetical protein Pmani_009972 [Petrolisthes manimaculis]